MLASVGCERAITAGGLVLALVTWEDEVANIGIAGVGAYVPALAVSNSELEAVTGLRDAWVRDRIGVVTRRRLAPDESVTSMAVLAFLDACRRSGISPSEVDMLVTSTNSPERIMPGLGVALMDAAGLDLGAIPVDVVGAGCAGAVGMLHLGARLVGPGARTVAVVASEASSRLMDTVDVRPGERLTTTIFGDGATCWLLRECRADRGILFSTSHTNPADNGKLALYGTDVHGFTMDAAAVKSFALREVPSLVSALETGSGFKAGDADLLLFHQANLRLIEAVLDGLDIPRERTVTTVQDYGNTVSASVGITAVRAADAGALRPGALVFLAGFGAGWSTAGSVVRWCSPDDFA
ncbi:3-oxoacyl-ACP synthase III family protein [Kitasatospora sp. NPDC088783]|uniref:3-oxoacyl-ACP synthase III family protein n=1 Tax=Kitasatospora sp. NPDC088783 TaxID=3364077 RepID=UPI00381ECD44